MAVSGITLRLRRVPVSEERAANDVLDALERGFDLLPKPTQEHIRAFLAERITSAQEESRASGDPEWRRFSTTGAGLTCDWSTGPLPLRAADCDRGGDGWRTLDRGDHGLLSGGAKVVTLMQPFVATLHAMYDQAQESCGLDRENSGVAACWPICSASCVVLAERMARPRSTAECPRRAGSACGARMPPAASAGRRGPPRGAARGRNGARGNCIRYCRHVMY
jgi:hypothetical protein